MTVRKRALKTFRNLNEPVSYRILDSKGLSDARNVYDNKGVTETRFGLKRYNSTTLGGPILSVSYFKKSDGTSFKICKVGNSLYSVSSSGSLTVIKSGLSATTKHRAVTLTDRHIIAIESDGLFSWDGVLSLITPLGQLPPTGATAALASGGSLLTTSNYTVGITFYASVTGFETNIDQIVVLTPTAGQQKITISSIPTIATNKTIDKVRVYLKKDAGAFQLYAETTAIEGQISLGTATFTIQQDTISQLTPPVNNNPPISGGAKYLALYGKKIVYSGNATYPNDVFFSEEYLPDAFNRNIATQLVLQCPGQGPITGIGVGLYNNLSLDPFLMMFKKNSTHMYSDMQGFAKQMVLDERIGCVSHDTIKTRNGAVVFMSDNGWRAAMNGTMFVDTSGVAATLGQGTIDSIFSRVGWQNELNLPQAERFFSAYYTINDHYITFVCEGSSTRVKKAYAFEEKIGGFRPFEFKYEVTCACEGEDDDGYQTIFIGDATGTLFTYSSRNRKSDEDNAGNLLSIPAYALLPYVIPGEDANSFNFRTLAVRALTNQSPITVKTFPSFSTQIYNSFLYDFSNTSGTFILDASQLDVGVLGDDLTVVTAMVDLNQTGETLLVGFFQDVIDANIGLLSAQLTCNKNGNNNK